MSEPSTDNCMLLIWRKKSKAVGETNHCLTAPKHLLEQFVKKNRLRYKMTSISYYDIGQPVKEQEFISVD